MIKTAMLIIPLFFIFFIGSVQADTMKLNETSILEDTSIDEANPTSNYGSSDGMSIGESGFNNRDWTLIKFDISDSSLPGSTVSFSEFCVWMYGNEYDTGETPDVWTYMHANQTWTEKKITWNSYQQGTVYGSNVTVIDGDDNDRWVCANVTNVTQIAIDNSWDNLTLIMNASLDYGSNDKFTVYQRDCSLAACNNKDPYLEITYAQGVPKITIANPANTTYITSEIDFNVTTDNNADACNFSLNGWDNITMDKLATSTFGYHNSSMTEGQHNISYSCNTSGGTNHSAVRWFKIDTAKPIITISQPWNTTYENNSISFNISGNKDLSWVAVQILGSNSSNFTNTSGEWQLLNTSLSDSVYVVTLWFNDTVGNMNSTEFVFTINTLPPNYTAITPSSGSSNEGSSVTFYANWTQQWYSIDTVLFEIDGNNYSALPDTGARYKKTMAGLAVGDHTFKWHCNDTYGNTNSTSSYTYSITSGGSVSPGGGGGTTYEIITDQSCNVTIYPRFGISGSASPEKEIYPFSIRIYNKNVTQSFTATLSANISDYCSVAYHMDGYEIPPYGQDQFTINCNAPNVTVRGNVWLESNLGCIHGVPITIGPASDIFALVTNALKLLASGDVSGILVPILGVPLIIWAAIVIIMLILAVILWPQ